MMAAMSQPPPDELPRSDVSDPAQRPSERLPEQSRAGRVVVWLLLGVVAVAAFVVALWMLNPPGERLGRDAPDLVVSPPAAPKGD